MQLESSNQKTHYEAIHDEYVDHYFDSESIKFRNRFVYDKIFRDLNLNNKVVADLASGNGFNSLAVLDRFPKAEVIGFDISSKACEAYRKNLKKEAYEIDLTKGQDLGIKVDVVMIFGGLHHCVADLKGTFKTIDNLLKPDGLLLMYEPNSKCFLEVIRKVWYRFDRYFDGDTEHALDHSEILKIAGPKFALIDCEYSGGPAYFLIFNSLVFRIPLFLKPYIAPPLFLLESLYNFIPWKFFFPCFIARWKKI